MFLFSEYMVSIFLFLVRCGQSFNFQIASSFDGAQNSAHIDQPNNIDYEICHNGVLFNGQVKTISGTVFLLLTLVNYYFYIYCGSDVSLSNSPQ